jgi:N-acetylglutamate synthase-like GNAT family acetyltransferase
MYVRQAWKSDEVWLLEQFEQFGVVDEGFRSRDYVIAVESGPEGSECGFGRVKTTEQVPAPVAELKNLVVLDSADVDTDDVMARMTTKLLEKAYEAGCREAFFVGEQVPATSVEFEEVAPEDVPECVTTAGEDESVFMADVYAVLGHQTEEEKLQSLAEEFGLQDATTKYSI